MKPLPVRPSVAAALTARLRKVRDDADAISGRHTIPPDDDEAPRRERLARVAEVQRPGEEKVQ